MSGPTVVRHARRARDVGARGVAQRLARRAYGATGAGALETYIDVADIADHVPAQLPVPSGVHTRTDGRPIVGWVMSSPSAGSGGHTTLFRMIAALEAAGTDCVVFVYDRHGVDCAWLTAVIRRTWPHVRASVRDVRAGIRGVDAIVATGWETAHAVVRYGHAPMRRLYFIQDYEPYFYGHGAEYELAKMTYSFPFRRIVLGEMLAGMLAEANGLPCDTVPFGCDSSTYAAPRGVRERRGIVFYSRPEVARRGFLLACRTLQLFVQENPDHPVHVYGASPVGLDIPFIMHGRISTAELNELYGSTVAGLALSFTNITLVAEEMLAAGNIPVVNDMALARRVLANSHVRWAEPTARALADELSAAVNAPDVPAVACAAAASVVGRSWQPTADALVRIINNEVYGS